MPFQHSISTCSRNRFEGSAKEMRWASPNRWSVVGGEWEEVGNITMNVFIRFEYLPSEQNRAASAWIRLKRTYPFIAFISSGWEPKLIGGVYFPPNIDLMGALRIRRLNHRPRREFPFAVVFACRFIIDKCAGKLISAKKRKLILIYRIVTTTPIAIGGERFRLSN